MLVQLVLDLLLQAGLLLVFMTVVERIGVTGKGAVSRISVDSLGLEKT